MRSPIRFPTSVTEDDTDGETLETVIVKTEKEKGTETSQNTMDRTRRMSCSSSTSNDRVSNNNNNEADVFAVPMVPNLKNERGISVVPTSALRLLAEKGFLLGWEVSEMIQQDHPEFRQRRWRACFYDGRDGLIEGLGEGPRKALAKEAAAMDFLEKMQRANPHISLPNVKVPIGCRIAPIVLNWVESMCERGGLPVPIYTEDIIQTRTGEKYKFTITIGDQEFSDASFHLKFAKVSAAKKAWDALNDKGYTFSLDEIIKGNSCLGRELFTLVEREELHLVNATRRPPKRDRSWEVCELSETSGSPVPWNNNDYESSSSGRSSPVSSSGSVPRKKIKVAAVGESSVPHSLERIRKRIEERRASAIME